MTTHTIVGVDDWPKELSRILRKAEDGDVITVRTQTQKSIAEARLRQRYPDKGKVTVKVK